MEALSVPPVSPVDPLGAAAGDGFDAEPLVCVPAASTHDVPGAVSASSSASAVPTSPPDVERDPWPYGKGAGEGGAWQRVNADDDPRRQQGITTGWLPHGWRRSSFR